MQFLVGKGIKNLKNPLFITYIRNKKYNADFSRKKGYFLAPQTNFFKHKIAV